MGSFRKAAVLAVVAANMVFTGCNLTGGIDSADSREDKIKDAQAKMENGECDEAATQLDSIGDKDDRVNQMLGWAHLCRAGAKVDNTMSAFFSFNSGSNNFTVIGNVANTLIPSNDAKVAKIDQAVSAFTAMSAGNERQLWIAFAQLVKASGIIAKSSGDSVRVRKLDVSVSGCTNQTCTGGAAACTTATSGNMTAADTTAVSNAITAASNAVGSTTGLGALKDLPTNLNAAYSAAAASSIRCAVFNQMLAD